MDLSIVIPSYNERDNIRHLVERIHQALDAMMIDYEIWFVDDSTDDTVEVLAHIVKMDERVHVYHRDHARGLASAVVAGFARATGEYIIVMDADLQHPPDLLPKIYKRLRHGSDIVIPSRFVPGGSDGGLGPLRKFISFAARFIGQVMLRRLRRISDCTSGFFGFHRKVVEHAALDPIGWKILIEILAKGDYRTVHEIPYTFLARDAGESKMSLKEQANYLRHILRLVSQIPEDRRFWLFCVVGVTGVVVNIAVLCVLKYTLAVQDVFASVIASLAAMLSNYIWNDQITWQDVGTQRKWNTKLPLFVCISIVGIAITTLVMHTLSSFFVPVPIGQTVGILLATLWSYTMNNRLTWRDANADARKKIVITREKRKVGPIHPWH